MTMGYHTGGKVECFAYDYKHKTQTEKKNGRKVFFKGSEIDSWTPSDIDQRAIEMAKGKNPKEFRGTVG